MVLIISVPFCPVHYIPHLYSHTFHISFTRVFPPGVLFSISFLVLVHLTRVVSMHRNTWGGDTRIISRCDKRYVNTCIAILQVHIQTIYYVKSVSELLNSSPHDEYIISISIQYFHRRRSI